MVYILALALALGLYQPPMTGKCIASNFGGADDSMRGGVTPHLGRRVRADDWGVAMRKGAYGTLVIIRNPENGRTVVAPIIDHGPYGAMHEGRWVLKKRRSWPGKWRGCLDLTYAVGRALGHRGFNRVEYHVIR